MSPEEKIKLIEMGNKALEAKAPFKAGDFFEKAKFRVGIIKVGNYFYNDRKPLIAYKYYKIAKHKEKLEQLNFTFVNAIKIWLDEDKKYNLPNNKKIPSNKK